MPMVTMRCPCTGQQVPTGLDMDQASWETLPVVVSTMRCPACGAEHVWSKTYARCEPARPVDPPSHP
ncbi:MAG: hypothetical protein J0H94_10040 [Rhizobiales bacterium]|nr:hypothetical protein [Hyphomicrobiales bacterium]